MQQRRMKSCYQEADVCTRGFETMANHARSWSEFIHSSMETYAHSHSKMVYVNRTVVHNTAMDLETPCSSLMYQINP